MSLNNRYSTGLMIPACRRLISVLIYLSIVMSVIPTVTAGVYRWVDENGKVHFTDRPPPDQKAKQVKIRKSGAGGDKRAVRSDGERKQLQQKLLDSYRQDRETKQLEIAKKKKAARERVLKCAYAKDQLREYLDAAGVYELQADGSRRVLSKDAHNVAIKEARSAVEQWCD